MLFPMGVMINSERLNGAKTKAQTVREQEGSMLFGGAQEYVWRKAIYFPPELAGECWEGGRKNYKL